MSAHHRPGILVMVNSLLGGGAEKHAISLVNRLDPALFRTLLCPVKADGHRASELDTVRAEAIVPLNVRGKLEWRAVAELARQIDRQRIDVVVCTNGYPLLYALLALRLVSRPLRLVEVFHTTGFRKQLLSRMRMLFNRFLFGRCELLVYVSHKQREYWHQRGFTAKRDTVIQNGIDTHWFTDRYDARQKAATRAELGLAPGDYVIGICAALRPEKAHGDLLHALRRLRDANVPAKVLIIGDGAEQATIERQIAELQLGRDVVLAGRHSDVRPYIACCDVMTLTSHSVETFSLAALESMALGKPVVLTRIGGAEEQVTPGVNGFLFEPGDIGALTQHLQRLAADEPRLTMGANAALTVRERFTIQRMVDSFAEELLQLAGSGRDVNGEANND